MFDSQHNAVRAAVFLALTQFCAAADIGAQLAPRLAQLDALIGTWQLSSEEARPHYRAANQLV
jgi:hypothetical protein